MVIPVISQSNINEMINVNPFLMALLCHNHPFKVNYHTQSSIEAVHETSGRNYVTTQPPEDERRRLRIVTFS